MGTGKSVVSGGADGDDITADAGDHSISGGSGNDTVTMDDAALTKLDTLSGDVGTDVPRSPLLVLLLLMKISQQLQASSHWKLLVPAQELPPLLSIHSLLLLVSAPLPANKQVTQLFLMPLH